MFATATDEVLDLVANERHRQDEKWGPQHHRDERWLAILAEEFGEVAQNVVEGESPATELLHVAAVCVAWVEDR